jgi:hypothetical protein
MTFPEAKRSLRDERVPTDEISQTVDEFCTSERISRAQFYVMQREGWGPRLMGIGRSVRISHEARRDWRRERERARAAGVGRKFESPASPEAA